MVGYKKLAIVAAGLLAGLAVEAQAAPFTETVFVSYNSSGESGHYWRRGTGLFLHFVVWRESNPEFSAKNISWVDRWSGDGGSLKFDDAGNPIDPETGENDVVPPWHRPVPIPEPGTALAAGSVLAGLALRRRVKA